MKNYIKSIIAIMTLLLVSLGAMAAGTVTVNGTEIINNDGTGGDPFSSDKGTVAATIDNNRVVTLTVTPAEGYFVTKDNITAIKTVDGEAAQTRAPGFNTPLTITGNDIAIGPNGKTFTFTIPEGGYDAEVTVDFQAVIDIKNAVITLANSTFTYDGTEKKPAVSSIKLDDAELSATYYTVSYSNNTNAGTATVTVTGSGIYKNAATKTFTIGKGAITLSYSATTAEGKMGETFTAPTLNNPSQVAVTYSSSNTEVATIGTDGAVTLKGPGKTTISATFAGNDNYEAQTASYELTVGKMEDAGLSWTDKGMTYYLGDYWYGPRLNNPNKLKVKYESSNEEVATIDEDGKVTPLSVGNTWIMAVFEGNERYEPLTVRYGLQVKERYNLLVDGDQVTSDNCKDILGNGQFFYNEDEKMLVVTNSTKAVDIENRKGDLTIFLNGNSKLGRIFFNKGETDNSGKLTITTYENIPGATTLETSDANGVISGFSSLNIDSKTDLFLLDPEEGTYSGGRLKTAENRIAQNATIGQYIKPLVKGRTIDFPIEKFENTKLTNTVIDDVHYALVQHDEDTDEEDDYYDPDIRAVVINNLGRAPYDPLYNPLAEDLLGDLIPGSRKYASEAKSLMTFMVPDGKGKISFDVETDPDHHLNLTIGNGEPKRISKNKREKVEFDYDVDKPTYCFLYLGEGGTGASGTRIGKREKSHGKVFSLKVSPTKTLTTNPLGGVSGFPDPLTPEVDTFGGDDPTGINEIKVEKDNSLESNDDNWYDLRGRRIDKPTKAGIYIQNRKKIVIR